MIVIYQGIESVAHRDTLLSVHDEFGIPVTGSMSYHSLKRRKLSRSKYLRETAERMPLVLEGGYTGENINHVEAEVLEQEYYKYALQDNAPWTFVIQFSHPSLPQPRHMPEDSRVIPAPLLHQIELFDTLLEERGGLAIAYGKDGDKRVPALFRKYLGATDEPLIIALAQPDLALAHRSGFNAVLTQAWLGPEKYGELSLWDGGRFHRSSAEDRDRLLKRYSSTLESTGFDPEALATDSRERARLSAWSFAQWALSLPKHPRPTVGREGEVSDSDDEASSEIVTADSEGSTNNGDGGVKKPRPVINLPVFAVDSETRVEKGPGGRAVLGERPVVRADQEPIRVCDSCFLATTCPAYEAGATCTFKVPVEIRDQEQVKALLNAMIEMQATRVAFARYAEEVNGGYPDDVVGREMDRLFRMAEKSRRIDERRERLTVSVESSNSGGGGAGVLSRIFGSGNEVSRGAEPQEAIEAPQVIEQVVDNDPFAE